ncbi:MAG: hypothetical protein LBD67_05545 [Candidatus Accumulibacter sp.]|nr:hypothetical protein [Accumulibacter sp.]
MFRQNYHDLGAHVPTSTSSARTEIDVVGGSEDSAQTEIGVVDTSADSAQAD